MRRIKKIFSLLLCGMFCLLPAACAPTSNNNGAETESSYVQLENFNSFATICKLYCDKSIGDGDVSKDLYSEGDGSFKVQVAPETEENKDQMRSTFFYVPTQRETVSYLDFSKIDQISLDVYGAAGTDLSVSISVCLKGKSVINGPAETFEVKNGEWSTVYFNINRTVTNALVDITKITHVRIACAGVNAVICVDNLQLHKSGTDFVEAEATLDKDEFCDFEKAYQSFMCTTRESLGVTPMIEVVTDPEWASSGVRSLKVTSPELLEGTYYWLTFSTTLCKASNIAKYPDTSYLVMDIYKPFQRQWSFTVRLVNDTNSYTNNKAIVPEGIGWHTICVPLKNRVTQTSIVQFTWHSKNGLENGGVGGFYYYVDNLRFMDELPTNGSIYVLPENA